MQVGGSPLSIRTDSTGHEPLFIGGSSPDRKGPSFGFDRGRGIMGVDTHVGKGQNVEDAPRIHHPRCWRNVHTKAVETNVHSCRVYNSPSKTNSSDHGEGTIDNSPRGSTTA